MFVKWVEKYETKSASTKKTEQQKRREEKVSVCVWSVDIEKNASKSFVRRKH